MGHRGSAQTATTLSAMAQSDTTELYIDPAVPAETSEIAALLAMAFERDPSIGGLLEGDPRRVQRLERTFRILIGDFFTHGCIEVARAHGESTILGAALWRRPGHRTSWLGDLRSLPAFALALGRHIALFVSEERIGRRYHPTDPHWYLSAIAASPTARGRGVGSALLRHRLLMVDREHQPAYLEASTAASARLYQRFGFRALRQLPSSSEVNPVSMWRDPPLEQSSSGPVSC